MKVGCNPVRAAILPVLLASLALSACASSHVTTRSIPSKEQVQKQSDGKGTKKSASSKKSSAKDKKGKESAAAKNSDKNVELAKVPARPLTLVQYLLQPLGLTQQKTKPADAEAVEDTKKSGGKAQKDAAAKKALQKSEVAELDESKKDSSKKDMAKKDVAKKDAAEIDELPIKEVKLAQLPSTAETYGTVSRTGEVYLFRGLANVFSLGLDDMARKLVADGVDARVYNHSAWKEVADNIIARDKLGQVSYPVMIMGHSLGANVAVTMASYLGSRGVKVEYVVSYDPTLTTRAGRNVKQVTNYYLPNKRRDNVVVQAKGFSGKVRNVDMTGKSVNHFIIEKNLTLQNEAIEKVLSSTKPLKEDRKKMRG